jgi:hypothetical protein
MGEILEYKIELKENRRIDWLIRKYRAIEEKQKV